MSNAQQEERRSHGLEPLLLVLLFFCFGLFVAPTVSLKAQTSSPPKLIGADEGPVYPQKAESKMIVGNVIFRAQVNEKGAVESVHILRVPEQDLGFEESVQDTVKHWRFEPARANGLPVVGIYVGKIAFSLRPEEEKAIREVVDKAVAAWNKGDVKKLASHFDKEEGRIQGRQELARSSKNVEKWILGQLSGEFENTDLQATVDSIQFFPTADLALVRPDFSVSAGKVDDGPMRGQLRFLLHKDGSRWTALTGQIVRQTGAHELEGPKKVKEPAPAYPNKAKKDRVQGTVVLEGMVSLEGNVTQINVIRSIPELDQAAIDAVKTWEYEPATIDGVPTPMVTTITINFTLE